MQIKIFVAQFVFFFAVFFNAHAQQPRQIVIAHRGASGYATENTLGAVKIAMEQKADAVEVDIWRTIDDSIVVFHDRHTKRLAGDSLIVPEATFAQLRALSLKGGEYIPTLREVLNILSPETKIFIEIKCCWEPGRAGDVFPMVKEILQETKTINQARLISFNAQKLVDAKKWLPDVPGYWLTGQTKENHELLKIIKESGIDGINVHHSLANQELVDAIKEDGFGFFVWTVNDPELAAIMFHDYGVDGITTDYPERILEVLTSCPPRK